MIARYIRLALYIVVLGCACFWFSHTKRGSENVTLLVTFVICLVTTIYSLLTYEILLENQRMSRATSDSAALMEKSLRFPSSAHLSFRTVGTKNPKISEVILGVQPYMNGDYNRALEIAASGASDADFVFAVVENKGPGIATQLNVQATYEITDSGSANRNTNVSRGAQVPILEVGKGLAICVFISRLPTQDDGASLVSAIITSNDFYRDAIGDPTQSTPIHKEDHQIEHLAGSSLKIA